MNIVIITIGTRGDVQPYVALGKRLQTNGHKVTLVTCGEFQSFVEGNGLQFGWINNEFIEFMHTDDAKIAMERTGNLWESLRTAIRLLPTLRPMLERQIQDAWEATRSASPDLILFHPKSLAGRDFAERLQVPCMLAFYLPLFTPTSREPAMGFPKLRLGGAYNRWTYRMLDRATWWGAAKVANAWRQAV